MSMSIEKMTKLMDDMESKNNEVMSFLELIMRSGWDTDILEQVSCERGI